MTSVPKNLASFILYHAEKTPEAIAIVVQKKTIATYKEIKKKASSFAYIMQEKKIARLGLLADKTVDAYVSVIATAWSGIAYIPFSLRMPSACLSEQLELSSCEALFVDDIGVRAITPDLLPCLPKCIFTYSETVQKYLLEMSVQSILLNCDEEKMSEPKALSGEEEAYIIFTSGSSGKPKGVVISTRARSAYIDTLMARHQYYPSDRVAQPIDLSWDVSIANMARAFVNGGTLYLMSSAQMISPASFIRKNEITVWHSVPNIGNVLLEKKVLKENVFPSLRWTDFSGETLSTQLAKAWMSAAPNSILVNSYGPSEMVVDCLDYSVPKDFSGKSIPIGTVFEGTETLILKENGKPACVDEVGELLLAGDQQAEGYLNNPEQTNAAFIIREDKDGCKKRWYKTQDLVFQDKQGIFHFKGRIGNQIKLLGYRVDLEEIEFHLRALSKIQNWLVTGYPLGATEVNEVIAFVQPSKEFRLPLKASELQDQLKKIIPHYMIPARFFVLDALPRTANGKLNRRALQQSTDTILNSPLG